MWHCRLHCFYFFVCLLEYLVAANSNLMHTSCTAAQGQSPVGHWLLSQLPLTKRGARASSGQAREPLRKP